MDADTSRLDVGPDVTVVEHDLHEGLPVEGPFDVIHARCLVMHMADRAEVLTMLADALAPGGWPVLGDLGPRLPSALSAPTCDGFLAFNRLIETGHGTVGPKAGISFDWALECGTLMERAGLVDVHCQESSFSFRGGDTGAGYLRSILGQLEAPLQGAGLTREELEHA